MTLPRIILLSLILCSGFLPFYVSAHNEGASWETPSGPFTVDVSYDTESFTEGIPTRFDFALWRGPSDGAPEPFDQVWVQISAKERYSYLATGIFHQPLGPTTLLYTFTQPGSYTFSVSYREKDGKEIAVADFPVTVLPVSTSRIPFPLPVSVVGSFFLGGALVWFLVRLKVLTK